MSEFPQRWQPTQEDGELIYKNVVSVVLADGVLDVREIEMLAEVIEVLKIDSSRADKLFAQVHSQEQTVHVPQSREACELSMDLMVSVCKIDGVLAPEELTLLKKAAVELSIESGQFNERMENVTFSSVRKSISGT